MNVRDYKPSDEGKLREIFAKQGFEYDYPDFSDPAFVSIKVVTDDADQPRQIIAARQTLELYMMSDSSWETPGWRYSAFLHLHEVTRKFLCVLGFKDGHVWLPPQVEKSFGRRLIKLGWIRPKWIDYWRSTEQ